MKLTHDEAYLYIGMELEEAFDPERSKLSSEQIRSLAATSPRKNWRDERLQVELWKL